MKRFWIGVVLLTALFAAGVGLCMGITALHHRLSRQLDDACAAVQLGDWEKATALTDSAKAEWERWQHFVASFVDHAPLEQMESLFAELEVFRNRRLAVDYAAICTNLSHLSKAIGESHKLTWWSFL